MLLVASFIPSLAAGAGEAGFTAFDPPDGAILNRHDGETTGAGLRIRFKGRNAGHGPMRVNGKTVAVANGKFETQILLTERENKVRVEGPAATSEITLLWDRDSFPRYRFSTDDNIWFLRDIARNADRYHSIFENSYLAMWRDFHRKYGVRIHHNIYYEQKASTFRSIRISSATSGAGTAIGCGSTFTLARTIRTARTSRPRPPRSAATFGW